MMLLAFFAIVFAALCLYHTFASIRLNEGIRILRKALRHRGKAIEAKDRTIKQQSETIAEYERANEVLETELVGIANQRDAIIDETENAYEELIKKLSRQFQSLWEHGLAMESWAECQPELKLSHKSNWDFAIKNFRKPQRHGEHGDG